jgi:hypothetical protein
MATRVSAIWGVLLVIEGWKAYGPLPRSLRRAPMLCRMLMCRTKASGSGLVTMTSSTPLQLGLVVGSSTDQA